MYCVTLQVNEQEFSHISNFLGNNPEHGKIKNHEEVSLDLYRIDIECEDEMIAKRFIESY